MTIQLVSNWMIDQGENVKERIEIALSKKIKELSFFKEKEVHCRIDTPMEIFKEIMEMVERDGQGRRYGHPILDLAREFNRYLKPSYLHKNFKKKEEFIKYTQDLFADMFAFDKKAM